MAVSQAPLTITPPPTKRAHAYRTRYTLHYTLHTLRLAWIWYEVWLPLTLTTWAATTRTIPPTWTILVVLALAKTTSYRQAIRDNITGTYARQLILAGHIERLHGRPYPRIRAVHLGTRIPWPDVATQYARYRRHAIPYNQIRIHVEPHAHLGDPKWADTFTDFLARRHGFTTSSHTTDPTDRNTYIITLTRDTLPDIVEAR